MSWLACLSKKILVNEEEPFAVREDLAVSGSFTYTKFANEFICGTFYMNSNI